MSYRIFPVSLGTNSKIEKSTFLYRKDCGTRITASYPVFLVRSAERTILVDSGAPNPSLAEKLSYPKLENASYLSEELKKRGCACEDIDAVILTHLHWDHCFNLELFPEADVYVQKTELMHAVCPSPYDKYMYVATREASLPGWMTAFQRMKVIDGDAELFPGIRCLLTPGHTPGQMSVLIDTEKGQYVIASDLLPLYENIECGIPNGICISFADFYESLEKLRRTGAEIIPGHDIKLAEIREFG